jgi:hypothetical protein
MTGGILCCAGVVAEAPPHIANADEGFLCHLPRELAVPHDREPEDPSLKAADKCGGGFGIPRGQPSKQRLVGRAATHIDLLGGGVWDCPDSA